MNDVVGHRPRAGLVREHRAPGVRPLNSGSASLSMKWGRRTAQRSVCIRTFHPPRTEWHSAHATPDDYAATDGSVAFVPVCAMANRIEATTPLVDWR
jgi:hypothetical protein